MLTQRQLFLNHVAQTSPFPMELEIVRAKGMYYYDKNGKSYMDIIAGASVSNIGHCHPEVVKAVKKQAETFMHLIFYGEYIMQPQVELAKYLSDILPQKITSVYFTNSGSESTEGALKLSKRYTGRSKIVALKNSYHGSTHGSLSVMGKEEYKAAYRPLLPGINFISLNKIEDLKIINEETAAVIIELVQGEAGIKIAGQEYMKALRKRCDETGCLLIIDEVQTGFGRTGKMFAYQHYGIEPDIITMAKGLGGGMPIGAFASSKEIMNCFTHKPVLGNITTFGGHPVSCSAALANVKHIVNHKKCLIESVEEKEKLFVSLLKHKEIKHVRSKGLMLAIELDSFEKVEKVIHHCIKNGIVLDWFLHNNNSLRVSPPLIINKDEITRACKIIIEALNEIEN